MWNLGFFQYTPSRLTLLGFVHEYSGGWPNVKTLIPYLVFFLGPTYLTNQLIVAVLLLIFLLVLFFNLCLSETFSLLCGIWKYNSSLHQCRYAYSVCLSVPIEMLNFSNVL